METVAAFARTRSVSFPSRQTLACSATFAFARTRTFEFHIESIRGSGADNFLESGRRIRFTLRLMSLERETPGIDVKYLAQLARLSLTAEQAQKFGAQLQQIVTYVEKLKEVNVEGIEPTAHATPITNVFRADEPRTPADSAPFLKNAPLQANDLFMVPKIVE